MEIFSYIAAFIFVIALIGVGAWLLKNFLGTGATQAASFFTPKEKRVGVVEAASVDGRRKLIILRRDNVEHLVMTGGPVDIVIETGISAEQAESAKSFQSETATSKKSFVARKREMLVTSDE